MPVDILLPVAIPNLGRRQAPWTEPRRRYQCCPGSDRDQKWPGGRGFAAMMRHLQNIRPQQTPFGAQQRPFRGRLDIAG